MCTYGIIFYWGEIVKSLGFFFIVYQKKLFSAQTRWRRVFWHYNNEILFLGKSVK